ncbi:MAG: hypothetical protein KDD14_25025, partial [Saprospiraceae bacterium]|nr:hypothetical protein [Saprospiraceae bacterium]
FRLIPPNVLDIARETTALYHIVPSNELWNLNIVDNTLSQVEYMIMAGRFEDPQDALEVIDAILDLLAHIQKMAEAGRKFAVGSQPIAENGAFHLFYNELASTNNTVLAAGDQASILATTLGAPNFIITTNEKICHRIEEWFKKIMSSSTYISAHSAKDRNLFFNRLEKKVLTVKERIDRFLGE